MSGEFLTYRRIRTSALSVSGIHERRLSSFILTGCSAIQVA
jgi:hypothetical protein